MNQKVKMFFELIRAIYGASRYEAQWPDSKHEEAAMIMWADKINQHTEHELRLALDHAQRMASNAEKDWQWPNIALILSGARTGIGAHKPFLIPPDETPEQKMRRKELAQKNIARIMDMLNGKEKANTDTDFNF